MQENGTLFETLEEGEFIKSPGDLARLNIIDFNRYKTYWKSPSHALDIIASYIVGFRYSIVKIYPYRCPERSDFPGWKHAGRHEDVGRLFWNFFKYVFDEQSKLYFHDQPDLSGSIYNASLDPNTRVFHGDIGLVSPITFLDTNKFTFAPHMWISVNEDILTILEAPPVIP